MDQATLTAALNKALDERNQRNERQRLPDDVHEMHHAWVARCIERDKLRAERWEKLRNHVAGWGSLALLGWVAYRLGDGILSWFLSLLPVPKVGP